MKKKSRSLEKILEYDKYLFQIGKEIRILEYINWPETECQIFMEHYEKGRFYIPNMTYRQLDFSANLQKLSSLVKEIKAKDGLTQYVHNVAEGYYRASDMLSNVGKKAFTDRSIELYGSPRAKLENTSTTFLEAAKKLLEFGKYYHTQEYHDHKHYSPAELKALFVQKITETFGSETVEVEFDERIHSLMAVSRSKIKIRPTGIFDETKVRQLWAHEVEVHLLTALNGSKQTYLPTLGLGSPRATIDQEGLASFAELMAGTLDFPRLIRLALRVVAIDMALEGADFKEVFEFFLNQGQHPRESFYSTARVFRGGDVNGRIVFTKDIVYIVGILRVFNFFRHAISTNRQDLIKIFFAGKMNISEVPMVQEAFEQGIVIPPAYLPTWASNQQTLAATLLLMTFVDKIFMENPMMQAPHKEGLKQDPKR